MRFYQGGNAQRIGGVVAVRRRGAGVGREGRRRMFRVLGTADAGAVTAEIAVVLPALVVLLALLLGTAHIGVQQLRLEEAARAGAREIMRGESEEAVHRTTQRLAGEGAATTFSSRDGWTTIEVRASASGPVIEFLDVQLTASASGRAEQDG